jgi:hypothetical protein
MGAGDGLGDTEELDNGHATLDLGFRPREVGVRGIDNNDIGVYGLLDWDERPTLWI